MPASASRVRATHGAQHDRQHLVFASGHGGCKQAGLNWVLNPWDNLFFEFDIVQCGWTWIELRVNCNAELPRR